jgi:hypothetical protein
VLPLKTAHEKATELLGSLLLSALVGSLAALIGIFFYAAQGNPLVAEQYAWSAIVSVLGAWSILIPAKFWEGTRGEPWLRRFVLMIAGLALGAVAWALQSQSGLIVSLPYGFDLPDGPIGKWNNPAFYDAGDGAPLWTGFVVYFGFLFLVPRWWQLAEPLREHRFRLGRVFGMLLWAGLLSIFWPFPQPWGMIVATSVATAVQLASPCVHPNKS